MRKNVFEGRSTQILQIETILKFEVFKKQSCMLTKIPTKPSITTTATTTTINNNNSNINITTVIIISNNIISNNNNNN